MKRNKKRIVVALGGNALGNTPAQQLKQVRAAAGIIADLAAEGHELIIGHGNGPQVGIINSAMNYAAQCGPRTPYMPFAECGAMSQGFIGYHLQQALQQSLQRRGIGKTVVSVVTQVEVDPQDPAFLHPTKPIGNFYTREEAEEISAERGFTFVEDAGRGYRRVVPSPRPRRIVELGAIRKMVQSGLLVIAAGGGGIPVVEEDGELRGIDAVVDKDMSCSRLAVQMKADMLLILTAVDRVCINFNRPDQKALDRMTIGQAQEYIKEGQFAPGSMLPKVEACLEFAGALPGRAAVITSLESARAALDGLSGTWIRSEETVPGGMARYGEDLCGEARCGADRCEAARCEEARYGADRYGEARYGSDSYGAAPAETAPQGAPACPAFQEDGDVLVTAI